MFKHFAPADEYPLIPSVDINKKGEFLIDCEKGYLSTIIDYGLDYFDIPECKEHVERRFEANEELSLCLNRLYAAKCEEDRLYYAMAYLFEVGRFLRKTARRVYPDYSNCFDGWMFYRHLEKKTREFATSETLKFLQESMLKVYLTEKL